MVTINFRKENEVTTPTQIIIYPNVKARYSNTNDKTNCKIIRWEKQNQEWTNIQNKMQPIIVERWKNKAKILTKISIKLRSTQITSMLNSVKTSIKNVIPPIEKILQCCISESFLPMKLSHTKIYFEKSKFSQCNFKNLIPTLKY